MPNFKVEQDHLNSPIFVIGRVLFMDIVLNFPQLSTFSVKRAICFCHPFLVHSLICVFVFVGGNALMRVELFSFIATSFAAASVFSFSTIPTYPVTQQKFILWF